MNSYMLHKQDEILRELKALNRKVDALTPAQTGTSDADLKKITDDLNTAAGTLSAATPAQ